MKRTKKTKERLERGQVIKHSYFVKIPDGVTVRGFEHKRSIKVARTYDAQSPISAVNQFIKQNINHE